MIAMIGHHRDHMTRVIPISSVPLANDRQCLMTAGACMSALYECTTLKSEL